jgi:hypothetical protein
MKLADVLWDAANAYLALGSSDDQGGCSGPQLYSCHAIYEAINPKSCWRPSERLNGFLASLGCDFSGDGFDHIQGEFKRQGVRYMWLLLAMHVAEDLDIEI